ncbi:Fkbp-type peptidyl-prolyl cis-trans isomerase, partial [Globisporangium splendens]
MALWMQRSAPFATCCLWVLYLLYVAQECHAKVHNGTNPVSHLGQTQANPPSIHRSKVHKNEHPQHKQQQRELLGGLGCDLEIYKDFIDSDEGQDIFIMATMCESKILYLKNERAGFYGSVGQASLRFAVCPGECAESGLRDDIRDPRLLLGELGACCARTWANAATGTASSRIPRVCAMSGCFMALLLLITITHTKMIAWKVFGDAAKSECVAEGSFPVERVLLNGEEGACKRGEYARGFQLASQVCENARVLLQKMRENGSPASSAFTEFPIAKVSLTMDGKESVTSKQQEKEDAGEWHCRLEVVRSPQLTAFDAEEPQTWFKAKAARGAVYRTRGNDAFKREKYKAAIRAYKKALRWLVCPEGCKYDAEEASVVDTIAVACHSNLATSFWKLQNMSACINHATQALQHDPEHVKALYRRSQAYLSTKAFENAVDDLVQAQQLDPDSKLIHSALERARSAQTQFQKKQKEAFAKMF